MSAEPDDVISNSGSTTDRWLRAMADIEHDQTPPDEPDAGDARRDQREDDER